MGLLLVATKAISEMDGAFLTVQVIVTGLLRFDTKVFCEVDGELLAWWNMDAFSLLGPRVAVCLRKATASAQLDVPVAPTSL